MKKTKYTKLPPYKGQIYQGCLNCPPVLQKAKMNMLVGVGFGYAVIKKNDEIIFREEEDDNLPILMKFELMARKAPDFDWRCLLEAPLRSREYQRQGKNNWILIDSGQGFA